MSKSWKGSFKKCFWTAARLAIEENMKTYLVQPEEKLAAAIKAQTHPADYKYLNNYPQISWFERPRRISFYALCDKRQAARAQADIIGGLNAER